MFRFSALLAALCLTLSGCGITLAPVPGSGPTAQTPVVSLTFDDGRISDATSAKMLAAHGLHGTFFINSGNIGKPGYLTLDDLKTIALGGNEIGGHTVNHPNLSTTVFNDEEIKRQICEDRNTLLGWGFQVRNFAYPYGYSTPAIKQMVADCGYNSARALGGVTPVHPPTNVAAYPCVNCTSAETIPPGDPMWTRAPAQVKSDWTVDDLKNQVTSGGDGWVQLTFHGVCPTDCSDITVAKDRLDAFMTWLADQQAAGKLVVRTVGDVISGPVRSPVPGPPPTTTVGNVSLEVNQDGIPSCWQQSSWGDNRPEFSLVPHDTGVAERLVMNDYVDGDATLMPTMDLGTCSPAVLPGQTYTLSAWYTSTVPTAFSVQYRSATGVWSYGTTSPPFDPAAEWTGARWTMPPIPEGVTAISFGLALEQNGELVTDDYALEIGSTP